MTSNGASNDLDELTQGNHIFPNTIPSVVRHLKRISSGCEGKATHDLDLHLIDPNRFRKG